MVIACMGILISILIPSLLDARMKAKQAVCLSNTKQWGRAITEMTVKRNGQLPRISHNSTRPHAVSYDNSEELNAEELNHYLGDNTFNTKDFSLGTIAICPSAVNEDVFQSFNDPKSGHQFYPKNNLYLSMYQYFGQSQLADSDDPDIADSRRNGAHELLIENELDPDRIMLTDFTLRNNLGRRWFNHENSQVRLNGSDVEWDGTMTPVGMSRLWGDGRAEWHYVSKEDQVEMEQPNPPKIPYFRAQSDNVYFGSAQDLP